MKKPCFEADCPGNNRHLAFLDPIRVWLTALVILHHTSISYGGSGSWYYQESDAPQRTTQLLSMFTGINQTYFMGFFFLLAGYLMPASIARKGSMTFLGERMVRLWLPLWVFGYLLDPLAKALATGARGGNFLETLITRIGSNGFGHGPLWFNQALLIGALVWVFLSRREQPRMPSDWHLGLHISIALAILGCGLLAFALRLIVPVGQSVFGIQLGYCASYLFLFFGGAWIAHERLLERISWKHAWPWLIVSLLSLPTLWIAMALSGLAGSTVWRGGWNLAALHYAMWEPLVATGIIMTLLALARRWFNRGIPLLKQLAGASYAAFVVHAPVTVACSWLVQGWADTHLQRFLLAGSLSCILSFSVGMTLTYFLSMIKIDRPTPHPA